MINHIEMSFQMGFISKLIEMNLKSYGHVSPLIVLVNKGKNLDIDLKCETLIDSKVCRIRQGMLLVEEEPEPEDIYVHVFMLRLRTDEDEKVIPGLFSDIANKYKPDGLAYVQSCLYNEYSDPEAVSREEMLGDPENIHVIHMCYYLKDDPRARMSIMPYLNKGEKKLEEKSFEDVMSEETPDYNILLSDCGWFGEYSKVSPLMAYPY